MRSSKSQIYILDLIFSMTILVVSIGVAASYFGNTTDNQDIYTINSQILNGLTLTEINSLNNEEIREMFRDNEIKNPENTVAQQIGEFYDRNNTELAENLTRVFVGDFINDYLNLQVRLYDTDNSTFELFRESRTGTPFDEAAITATTKREVFGFINRTSSYGPYVVEVRVWQ